MIPGIQKETVGALPWWRPSSRETGPGRKSSQHRQRAPRPRERRPKPCSGWRVVLRPEAPSLGLTSGPTKAQGSVGWQRQLQAHLTPSLRRERAFPGGTSSVGAALPALGRERQGEAGCWPKPLGSEAHGPRTVSPATAGLQGRAASPSAF